MAPLLGWYNTLRERTADSEIAAARCVDQPAADGYSLAHETVRLRRLGRAAQVTKSSVAVQRAAIDTLIAAQPVSATHKRAMTKQVRASIQIYTKRVADLPIGVSRFGGTPDLPPDQEWPRAFGKYPMTFIAQFDLAVIAKYDIDERLPKRGLLSFFVHDWLPPKTRNVQCYEEHAVVHLESVTGLERKPVPKDVTKIFRPFNTAALTFHTELELPGPYCGFDPVVVATYRARTTKRAPCSAGQLLGYDHHMGYSDALTADTCSLFRCTSDKASEMNHGDAQDIAFRISLEDLKQRRFDRSMLWLQAC